MILVDFIYRHLVFTCIPVSIRDSSVGKSAGLVIERLRVRIPAGAEREFSSPELTFCADSYSVSVLSPVLPQWQVKDPAHSAKSACDSLQPNTLSHTKSEWADYAVKVQCGNYQLREMSSHATCQGMVGHGRLSSLNDIGLIVA